MIFDVREPINVIVSARQTSVGPGIGVHVSIKVTVGYLPNQRALRYVGNQDARKHIVVNAADGRAVVNGSIRSSAIVAVGVGPEGRAEPPTDNVEQSLRACHV